MSAADALRAAAARLAAAGVDDARGDARRLLAHAFGPAVPRHALAGLLGQPMPDEVAARFEAAISARARRQPVSQILGFRDFWNHRFAVTRDTLDPRPETEVLVARALTLPWSSVLDLGTGTGAILVSLLAERPAARGTGTDVSDAALAVARANAGAIGVEARFQQADWYEGIDGAFDLIVSNPPYIAQAEMAALAPEVREWEPTRALTDGGDGLAAHRAIAAGAAARLTPRGHVLCEIGPLQGADVTRLFERAGATVERIRDLDGRDRVIVARFDR